MSSPMTDEFAKVASQYSLYRPLYPNELYDSLVQEIKVVSSNDSIKNDTNNSDNVKSIVDIGCGSGQFTYKLSTLFPNDNIIGIDKSVEQLKYAKTNSNITYKVGTALESNLNNSSIDIVTVAQAAHWFDMPIFIKEMKRVLKPGGLLAIAGYSFCQSYNININLSIRRYEATIKDCWPSGCNRTRLDSTFADVNFNEYFNYSTRKSFPVIRNMEIDAFLAYIRTMSALQVYANKYPDMPDPTKILEGEIRDVMKDEKNIDICFPFFLFSMKDEIKQL